LLHVSTWYWILVKTVVGPHNLLIQSPAALRPSVAVWTVWVKRTELGEHRIGDLPGLPLQFLHLFEPWGEFLGCFIFNFHVHKMKMQRSCFSVLRTENWSKFQASCLTQWRSKINKSCRLCMCNYWAVRVSLLPFLFKKFYLLLPMEHPY
jgi:hypothetical protein